MQISGQSEQQVRALATFLDSEGKALQRAQYPACLRPRAAFPASPLHRTRPCQTSQSIVRCNLPAAR